MFATYKPVIEDNPNAKDVEGKELSEEQWQKLYALSHTDKAAAYDQYVKFYLSTNGQKYWSDTHQLQMYVKVTISVWIKCCMQRSPAAR